MAENVAGSKLSLFGRRNINIAFVLFVLIYFIPFLFAKIPPLGDLPGHMGRYAVQVNIESSPLLRENWAFHWGLIANLGFDILIQLLSPFMSVERASWLLAALIAPITIWGLARVSCAVHGRLSPFLVLAAPFSMAFPFNMGFVNYCLSCGLAYHLFASWVVADKENWGIGKRVLLFLPGSLIVWLCHVYGWAIFAVLAGGYELVQIARAPKSDRLAAALAHLSRLLAISVPLVLALAWRSGAVGAETNFFFDFPWKFQNLIQILRDQNRLIDLLSIVFYLSVLIWVVVSKTIKLDYGLAFPAFILLLCEIVIPNELFGSFYADVRLWPAIIQIALLSPVPGSVGSMASRIVVGAGVLVAVARLAVMTAGFAQYDRDFTRHLRALDHVPAGASIVTFAPDVFHVAALEWRLPRLNQLSGLAIVRREAFVNSQWVIPGGQLLTALRAKGTEFNSDPSQIITPKPDYTGPLWPEVMRRLPEIPRDRFDYLWLIGFDMAQARPIPGAALLYADEESALYRLRPDVSGR